MPDCPLDVIIRYLAETADQPKLTVPHDDEMAYREGSTRHHASMPISDDNDETPMHKKSRFSKIGERLFKIKVT